MHHAIQRSTRDRDRRPGLDWGGRDGRGIREKSGVDGIGGGLGIKRWHESTRRQRKARETRVATAPAVRAGRAGRTTASRQTAQGEQPHGEIVLVIGRGNTGHLDTLVRLRARA